MAEARFSYFSLVKAELRLMLKGNSTLFIPAFAITSGILTGGSKLFEVIFTIMVYGILNSVPFFDFTGAIEKSMELGIAHYFPAVTLGLIILAFSARKKQ